MTFIVSVTSMIKWIWFVFSLANDYHVSTFQEKDGIPVKKQRNYIIILSVSLVLISTLLYFVHYLIFGDLHHIFIYLLGDLAFLPIEVLLVALVLERLIHRREQQEKMEKLNMVIGAFFSELGNDLLRNILPHFRNKEEISAHLNVTRDWTKADFKKAADFADEMPIHVDTTQLDLPRLKAFLSSKKIFIITLLENSSLLEHDRFTSLLWSITHLSEELEARDLTEELSRADLEHIAVDIRRMYDDLSDEWLDYVQHLKLHYPYLFSLILRTHPFQDKPSPYIK